VCFIVSVCISGWFVFLCVIAVGLVARDKRIIIIIIIIVNFEGIVYNNRTSCVS